MKNMTKRLKNKKKRKTLRRKYGGAYSEGFGYTHKKDIPKTNIERQAQNLIRREANKRKAELTTTQKSIKILKNSIPLEERHKHFNLAEQIIKRIIDSNPSDQVVNDYAHRITDEQALELEKKLEDDFKLLEFMKSHDLSTLK
jgi:hypothetical protein